MGFRATNQEIADSREIARHSFASALRRLDAAERNDPIVARMSALADDRSMMSLSGLFFRVAREVELDPKLRHNFVRIFPQETIKLVSTYSNKFSKLGKAFVDVHGSCPDHAAAVRFIERILRLKPHEPSDPLVPTLPFPTRAEAPVLWWCHLPEGRQEGDGRRRRGRRHRSNNGSSSEGD